MRLNDIVNEDQINELNALKNIAGALRGARDGGIKGAVSGYKASKATNQGDAHAKRIVSNLKSEFMRTVGGGHPATYDNLIKFLQARGLSKLETIPNPSVAPTATVPTPAPVTPETRIDPTLEDVNMGASLSNAQIDGIINNAVKINYSKIRQAQQGIFEPDDEQPAVDDPATPEEPVNKAKWTPNESDMKNIASWADAVEAGSQKMDDVPDVYKELVDQELAQRGVAKSTGAPTPAEPEATSATPAPEAPATTPTTPQQSTEPQVQPTSDFVKLKKSYEILSPQEREKLKQEFEIIDDHDRLATGTNESKKLKSNKPVVEFHSKFLRTTI